MFSITKNSKIRSTFPSLKFCVNSDVLECDILKKLPPPTLAKRGGEAYEGVLSFVSSVVAGVIANIISKWLDREKRR